jgi:hypothetical protein
MHRKKNRVTSYDGWEGPMDVSIIFDWFAQESVLAAELAIDQTQREVWLRLALMWAAAARESREEATQSTQPGT